MKTKTEFVIQFRLKFADAEWVDFGFYSPFATLDEARFQLDTHAKRESQEYRIVRRETTDTPVDKESK